MPERRSRMHQRGEENYLTAALVSFLAGSAIGAGLALLFAPQSGEYTRREMREKAERTIIKMHRMEDDLKHTMSDVIQGIRQKATQLMDDGREVAELKKQEILEAIAAGKKALEEERCRLAKAKQKA
jgi:gas vesicle protein